MGSSEYSIDNAVEPLLRLPRLLLLLLVLQPVPMQGLAVLLPLALPLAPQLALRVGKDLLLRVGKDLLLRVAQNSSRDQLAWRRLLRTRV